ncbi:Kelch-like protein 14 [Chelonia mydas]|uniref:Kelch-like protein 14 n=2 Tax=Archelosauria TaxID=1329799 RepID=M7BLW9_CHEMY|nr:Kelch-like protein 14 [Chelonia mydas]
MGGRYNRPGKAKLPLTRNRTPGLWWPRFFPSLFRPFPKVLTTCCCCLLIMPYNSAHHCVVEVENFLFVLGGEDQWNPNGGVHNGEYVPWLYCYDPVMDVWARKQDMNTKRAIHTLAVMNDRLYAIGGNHLKGFSHLDVMLVECYDPKGDQWNILQTPILEGRSGPGCAVLDDSIYLVGGYSWSMGAYKSSTICYSPEKGTWTELEGDVAEPLAGPACSTVILPACVPYNK